MFLYVAQANVETKWVYEWPRVPASYNISGRNDIVCAELDRIVVVVPRNA